MRVPALTGLLVAAVLLGGCTAAPAAPTATPAAPPTARAKAQGVRGQITAENGTSWTVTTARGRAFTVTLTPQTAFGTAKAPSAQSSFPVGTQVRVAGPVTGGSVQATRIVAAPATTTAPVA